MKNRLLASAAALAVAAATAVYGIAGTTVAQAGTGGQGGDYVPFATPVRILNTITGQGAPVGQVKNGSTTVFQATGVGGVPSGGVRAVLVDITLARTAAQTTAAAWPNGKQQGGWALTAPKGATVSNDAIIEVGANGKVDLNVTGGPTDLVVDVHGYFTSTSSVANAGGFVPITQKRFVDSRSGLGVAKAKIAAGAFVTVQFSGLNGIPAGANAVFMNVTVVDAEAAGPLVAVASGSPSGTASTFDYLTGTTGSGAAVKLNSAGKANFKNSGSKPINLVIDVFGYSTASSSTGAGFRVARARLLDTRSNNGAPIPAHGFLDMHVAGAAGLPTRGVAGVALNFTVLNAVGAGAIGAWPSGTTEPISASARWSLTWKPLSSMVVVQPGAGGVVRIHNNSDDTAHLVVDMQGYFVNPGPQLPIDQYAATTVAQTVSGASTAPLEYAYVDNIGRLVWGYQVSPTDFNSVQWTVISDNEAFTGTPSLVVQPNNTVRLVAERIDGTIWTRTHPGTEVPTWSAWSNLGGTMTGRPAVGKQPDGTVVVFAVDADGALWSLPQTGVNGGFSYWRSLVDINLAGTPTVVPTRDGLQVFALDTAGTMRTASYAGGGLSAWTSLGGTGLNGKVAVVVLPGFRMRVVARAADGTIVTKGQDTAGAFPSAWTTIGTLTAPGVPTVALSPTSGRVEIVVHGTDDVMYSTGETAQGSGVWRDWTNVSAGVMVATDPTAFAYTANGATALAVAVRTPDNEAKVFSVVN